jgi:hypothetical protein
LLQALEKPQVWENHPALRYGGFVACVEPTIPASAHRSGSIPSFAALNDSKKPGVNAQHPPQGY